MTRQWIEEVAGTCRAFGTDYLHVIIDQAGVDFSVIPALNSLSVEWQSLFHGLPEAFIVDDAPLVARFTLDDLEQMRWLQDISQQLAIQAPLLLFCTLALFGAGELAHAVYGYSAGRAQRNFTLLRYPGISAVVYAHS
jgi:hypothetical protein